MQTQNDTTAASDLYLMLGPHFDALHVKRCAEGAAGFSAFVEKEAHWALERGYFPDNWLFHYHFSEEQTKQLPQLSITRSTEFFRDLLPRLNEEKIIPRFAVPLERACLLLDQNKPLLATYEQKQTSRLRDFLPSGSNNAPEILKARPPFQAYTAVKMNLGTLLFTPTEKGMRLLKNFLQYKADHFFDDRNFFTIDMDLYRVPMFDHQMSKYADIWPENIESIFNDMTPQDTEKYLAPNDIFQFGVKCHHFDMLPFPHFFNKYVNPTEQTGLSISQSNTDLVYLHQMSNSQLMPKNFGTGKYRYEKAVYGTDTPHIEALNLLRRLYPMYIELRKALVENVSKCKLKKFGSLDREDSQSRETTRSRKL